MSNCLNERAAKTPTMVRAPPMMEAPPWWRTPAPANKDATACHRSSVQCQLLRWWEFLQWWRRSRGSTQPTPALKIFTKKAPPMMSPQTTKLASTNVLLAFRDGVISHHGTTTHPMMTYPMMIHPTRKKATISPRTVRRRAALPDGFFTTSAKRALRPCCCFQSPPSIWTTSSPNTSNRCGTTTSPWCDILFAGLTHGDVSEFIFSLWH